MINPLKENEKINIVRMLISRVAKSLTKITSTGHFYDCSAESLRITANFPLPRKRENWLSQPVSKLPARSLSLMNF